MSQIMTANSPQEATSILAELERRSKTAKDVLVPTKKIDFRTDIGGLPYGVTYPVFGDSVTALPLSPTAHGQTAEKLGIPKPYYDRMLGAEPRLLAENCRTWAHRDESKNWLLRTLDGQVRANLSDRYRSLDNHDLAFAALGAIRSIGAEISRLDLTDDRFEMRLLHPEWRETLKYDGGKGKRGKASGESVFVPGCYISNSETGKGGLNVRYFTLDLVCLNGMLGEVAHREVHLGGKLTDGHDLLTDGTKKLKDAALWAEVGDVIASAFDRERFDVQMGKIREASAMPLENPVEAVDAVVTHFAMSDEDKQAILNELMAPSHGRNAGATVLGLMNAITQRAHAHASNPERRTEFEEAGYEMVTNAKRVLATPVPAKRK